MDEATETYSAFWKRLRRSKVVQWGIAYVAAAWGLLQGVEYASGTFDWPRPIQQYATLAVLIGLPISLVLAWYHGDRGEQRASSSEIAILAALLLAGGGVLWWHQRTVEEFARTVNPTAVKSTVDSTDPRPSIAVLPFENRSRLEDDAYFVDGIHDDILAQLSRVSGLRVISRTSVERFRNTELSVQQIAQQLGVKSILEGGVQRAGDRVRINVQLIDAATDAHHWASTYDRELTVANMFAIQSEVAEAIAEALQTTLTPAERVRARAVPTQSLEAWENYQLGQQRMARRASESLSDAEAYFRKAIELDDSFALAYAGLADAVRLQIYYGGRPAESALLEADEAVSKALSLDSKLAEAWAAKGDLATYGAQDSAAAERMMRKAIELNPNYASAHHWLSLILRAQNRHEEELEHAERAVQLDPLSGIIVINLADSLATSGRFDEAAARYRRVIEVDPGSPVGYVSLAMLESYARNRFPEAVALQERAVALDPGSPAAYSYLVLMYLDIGETPRAKKLASSSVERWPVDFYSNVAAALMHELSGNQEEAQRYASRLVDARPGDANGLGILRNADLRKGDPKAALARYASAYPQLVNAQTPLSGVNLAAAIDLALVLQKVGEPDRASALLDAAEPIIRSRPRLGEFGYGIADVQVHALRGNKKLALAELRQAEKAGWRGPAWRYYRDFDPSLATIRDEPDFKAVFADIERDMARQRAELVAREKGMPRSSSRTSADRSSQNGMLAGVGDD